MNQSEFSERFASLSNTEKTRFLAKLLHELTVAARSTYEPGTDRLEDPSRLRAFNEIFHRISAQLSKLLERDSKRYPDEVFSAWAWEAAVETRSTIWLEQCLDRFMPTVANRH